VIGASAAELQLARDQLCAMLTTEGPAPQGRFADLAVLEPVKHYPARHASTLLAFEAVLAAVFEAQSAKTSRTITAVAG
jgi:NifU-like protein involved in Fe-S cluster formation